MAAHAHPIPSAGQQRARRLHTLPLKRPGQAGWVCWGVPARLHGTARTGVFRETDPKATGHSQFWGIGRHILGSQVPLLIA